jgi:SAM-dependent methyltransferase
MNWKIKARVQSLIARLPESLSYKAYYFIQRKFGNLSNPDPLFWLSFAADSVRLIHEQGKTTENATIFEVGTGRSVMFPVIWWLAGAEKTITVDLNPYFTPEVNTNLLRSLLRQPDQITAHLGSYLKTDRLQQLMTLSEREPDMQSLFDLCNIEYKAPSDAAETALEDGCIDIHSSFTVLEHIPPSVLSDILREGRRILKKDGLFVHNVDYSDHFSHTDSSISAINFLQYDEKEWHDIAGNRFMYMNRLRHDDYLELYRELGIEARKLVTFEDEGADAVLRDEAFSLQPRFAGKSPEVLKIRSAWHILSP